MDPSRDHGPERPISCRSSASGPRQTREDSILDDHQTPDGTNVRDYDHPFDLADAHLSSGVAWNGSSHSTAFNLLIGLDSPNQIVEAARKVTGHPTSLELAGSQTRRPRYLDRILWVKARAILGWQPKFDNIETIIQTVRLRGPATQMATMIDKEGLRTSFLFFNNI